MGTANSVGRGNSANPRGVVEDGGGCSSEGDDRDGRRVIKNGGRLIGEGDDFDA